MSGGKSDRRPSIFDTTFFMESFKFVHLRHRRIACMLNATDASPGDFHTERRNKMEQPSRSICEKRTYTVEEVAMLLGISRTSAYEFVKKGEVKFVKIGASIRISKKSFDEWLDQQNI